MKKSLGIYIHIPFCLKKCHYCDFCSFPGSSDLRMRDYTKELCRRMRAELPSPDAYLVDTVYFGGGTPTLLPLDCFEEIIKTLRTHTDLSPSAEITCECNPATASPALLRGLRALGINRLSIGLQSIHENELRLLGRAHSYKDFLNVFADARAAGFDNISADLMYGIPDQTVKSFGESLEALATLHPEHISAYGLKIEVGTPFDKMRDSLILPGEDEEYGMYLLCTEILEKHGYKKYEISNFSLEGRESRHNLRYWRRLEYLGFGVAAHSMLQGERFGNSGDIEAFVRGEDITSERVELCERDEIDEYVMLSLRLGEGILISELERRAGCSLSEYCPSVKGLTDKGFMRIENGRLFFTDKGFFVSNSILADMLGEG